MKRLALIKLVIAVAGILVWGYGARVDSDRIRLAGMIVIAAAVALRFLPASARERLSGVAPPPPAPPASHPEDDRP